MKRFLVFGMVLLFIGISIFAMKKQEIKKVIKQEIKQKEEKQKGFPQELTTNEEKDTLTSININNQETLSLETLKAIIEKQSKKNIPFIIARVTSMANNETIVASY